MLVATPLPSPTPAIVRTKSVCKHCQVPWWAGGAKPPPTEHENQFPSDSTFQAEAYPLLGTEFSLVLPKQHFLMKLN